MIDTIAEKYRIYHVVTESRENTLKEWSVTARGILRIYLNFFYWLFHRPFKIIQIVEQFMRCLIEGFVTIIIGSVVMGMFIAWLGGYFGSLYGSINLIGPTATFGIIHEFTILLVGMLYACRVGTAFTVEIGSMAMSGQLDAQRMMAVEPIQLIVIPRVVGSVLSILLLLGISNGISLISTTLFLNLWFQVAPSTILDNAFTFLKSGTVTQSFVRIALIGFFISLNACAAGFYFNGGAIELGKATTKSIVINFIYVLIIMLITQILLTLTGFFTDAL